MEFSIDLYTALVFLLVGILTYLATQTIRRPAGVPPGPPLWPIIGNIPLIAKSDDILVAFKNIRRRYGDIFSIKLGSQLIVVVNGYENLKDALIRKGDLFTDRPSSFIFDKVEIDGIIGASGDLWSNSRTFTLNVLKEFGFGKRIMQDKILKEVSFLKEYFKKSSGDNICSRIINATGLNVMTLLVYNKRYEHGDPKMSDLIDIIKDQIKFMEWSSALEFLPALENLPGDVFHAKEMYAIERKIEDFIKEEIEDHKHTFDENNHRDFVDAYISEMKKAGDSPDWRTDYQLLRICRDLIVAGTDTTSNTINWILLYLILKPEIQEKMFQEIKDVIGTDRQPDMTDKPKMPYIDAVCHEAMRYSCVVPLSAPRAAKTKSDTELHGFRIPKNTAVYTNLASVLFDEELFPNPNEFIPDRFMEGTQINKEKLKHLVQFSLGKRSCPGEVLARQELFLIVVSLVQQFKFLPPKDMPPPEPKRKLSILYFLLDFHMRVEPR